MPKIKFQGDVFDVPDGVTQEKLWIPNMRAGFDPAMGRYRDIKGRYASRAAAEAEAEGAPLTAVYGGVVDTPVISTPWSDAWSEFELALGGLSVASLRKVTKNILADADPMPRMIKAEMKRAAHFFWQEGDIAQSFMVPMELCLQDVYVESDDKAIEKLLNDLYGAEIGIDLRWHLYEIYLCAAIYGQAYPLELWEDGGDMPIPDNIIPLYPPDVKVGQRRGRENFDLSLPPPGGKWTEEHRKQLQPIQVALQPKWSESFSKHEDVKIDPDLCRPVRWHSLNFDRYAHPPLASMFRPITTRILVEEARRAVIEGYRHQLWFVQVGTPEVRGQMHEITHMRQELAKLAQQRTPTLLWSGNAQIETIAPKDLGSMMDDTLWLSITLDIMRRRGIALSVISGESPAKGAGRGDVDIDIRMLLMRLGWVRRLLLRWEAGLKRKMLLADSSNFWQRRAALKAKVTTHITPTPEEVSHTIEEHLRPLVGIGKVSDHSLLKAVNLDYESELKYKQEEEQYAHLFSPPITFKQAAVQQSGETTVTESPRRQQTQTEQNRLRLQMAASVLGATDEIREEDRKTAQELYIMWLAAMWALAELDAEQAVKELRELVRVNMLKAALMGYECLGGEGAVDQDWIGRGITFITSYAAGLEMAWDIMSAAALRWRLGLYAQEGMRIGYVLGLQQAAKEVHEASHWQRVLHPELSKTGPCIQCQEDSFHLHSIDEPFFEFHPQGVCSAQAIAFFRTDVGGGRFAEVDMPVSGDVWGQGVKT